jgi:hypothetical protein
MLINIFTDLLIVVLLGFFAMVVFPLAMPFSPIYAKVILVFFFVLLLGAVAYTIVKRK